MGPCPRLYRVVMLLTCLPTLSSAQLPGLQLGLSPPQQDIKPGPTTFETLLGGFSTPSPQRQESKERRRQSKQLERQEVPGGVDFSRATRTEDGRLCVIKEDEIETLSKDPVLDCTHKEVEKCHLTYVTYFTPAQEQQCQEHFEKTCQITFSKEAASDSVLKCYTPLEKVCNGQGPDVCRTEFETSCTTRYLEQSPGKFVGDTRCRKVPVEVCGQGCLVEEAPEECHEKMVDSLVDVPEENCDLNPQKTCRLVTRLVPNLRPTKECTLVPQNTCSLKFTNPRVVKQPLRTEWCLDREEGEVEREEEREPLPPVIEDNFEEEPPGYINPVPELPSDSYSAVRVADLRTALSRLKRFREQLQI